MMNQNEPVVDLRLLSNPQYHRKLPPPESPLETNLSTVESKPRIISSMDKPENKTIKVVLDFVLLALVGIPILILWIYGEPYRRGFFCNDQSIIHPFQDDTISTTLLVCVGICLPVATILMVELIRGKLNLDADRDVRLFSWNVPVYFQNLYKHLGCFGFGACTTQLTTDIAKYTIGRLRPHFIDFCQPRMPDGTTCSDEINLHRYIQEYSCSNLEASDKYLREMRLSFPSGHAAFGFYTILFLALYLQKRFSWKGSKLLKHVLQFLLIMMAFFTALSRISDYKHHWSDVFAGSILGIAVALIVAFGVSDLFKRPTHEKLPLRH